VKPPVCFSNAPVITLMLLVRMQCNRSRQRGGLSTDEDPRINGRKWKYALLHVVSHIYKVRINTEFV